jgi:hypothetical protein
LSAGTNVSVHHASERLWSTWMFVFRAALLLDKKLLPNGTGRNLRCF